MDTRSIRRVSRSASPPTRLEGLDSGEMTDWEDDLLAARLMAESSFRVRKVERADWAALRGDSSRSPQ